LTALLLLFEKLVGGGERGVVLVLVLRGCYSPGKGLARGEEVDSILIGRGAESEQVDVWIWAHTRDGYFDGAKRS